MHEGIAAGPSDAVRRVSVPRLGRLVSSVEWESTLYHWLDNVLYSNSEGKHIGQYELSSGTNQLEPPTLYTEWLRNFEPEKYWEINTYSGPLGDDGLREAILNYETTVSGWALDTGNVAVTYGAHDGLHIALDAFRSQIDAERAGEVLEAPWALVIGPQVPLLFQGLMSCGFTFRELWAQDARRIHPSAEEVLDVLAQTSPDLVVLTAPNNPTGFGFSASELAAIGSAAIEGGARLLLDKILSDSRVRGRMPDTDGDLREEVSGTCPEMGKWIADGTCVVIDSLSKRRAISGLRAGYMLASAEVVEQRSVEALGGCPPLLLATAAAADLNASARLHSGEPPGTELDAQHADDLRSMAHVVERNFSYAKEVLSDYWEWDTKQPGRFNCVAALRMDAATDQQKCRQLFAELVTCYPLSTFAVDESVLDGRDNRSLLELRLSCSIGEARFRETIDRTRSALRSVGGAVR